MGSYPFCCRAARIAQNILVWSKIMLSLREVVRNCVISRVGTFDLCYDELKIIPNSRKLQICSQDAKVFETFESNETIIFIWLVAISN